MSTNSDKTFQQYEQELGQVSELVNISVELRSLILEQGFCEVVLRNPKSKKERSLFIIEGGRGWITKDLN